MSKYPDSPSPQLPVPFRTNRPVIGGGPEWAPQNRALTRFSLGETDLTYKYLKWDELQILHDFFESVDGAAGRFTYVDFNGTADGGRKWSGLFVAQGDGSTLAWDLPTYELQEWVQIEDMVVIPPIYVNGTLKTTAFVTTTPDLTVDFNLKVGGGTDGLDLVTATGAPPADSAIITITGVCRRAFRRARFLNPKNPFTFDEPEIHGQGPVTIVEVRR